MSGRAWLAVLVSGFAGFGAALGVGACGEDDRGSVTIEGGTGTTGTGTTADHHGADHRGHHRHRPTTSPVGWSTHDGGCRSRSGPRAPGTSSTRAGRSRSSTRLLVLLARGAARAGARTARSASRCSARSALAAVLAAFPFPLRGRALLWLAAAAAVPLLEPWRAPALLLGALAGYVFFTVFFWGTLYYRLRTGAPWTNFPRFWRLVADQLRPDERQRARAGAEVRDGALGGRAAGRGAGRRAASPGSPRRR